METESPASAYEAALTRSAWIQRSDLAFFRMAGTEVLDFLHRVSTNDVRELGALRTQSSAVLSDKGRMVDLVHILTLESATWGVSSRQALPQLLKHLRSYVIMDDVRFQETPDAFAILEFHGPQSLDAISFLLSSTQHYPLAGHIDVSQFQSSHFYLMRSPFQGDEALWLIVPNADFEGGSELRERLESSVHKLKAEEALALRVEQGIGHNPEEWNEKVNPLEGGLLHVISFRKGCYIGQEVIARLDSYNKVQRRLVVLTSGETLQSGALIEVDGSECGWICSTTLSPRFGNCALGYIRTEQAHEGQHCMVQQQRQQVQATIHFAPLTTGDQQR